MRVEETKKEKKVDVKTIHLIHILDGSGSMGWTNPSKFDSAMEGMLEEIQSIRDEKSPMNYTLTIVEFDNHNRIKTVCNQVDPKTVELQHLDFFKPSGGTALFDAIGKTLSNFVYDKESSTVLVKIFTDGEENASREFKAETVKGLIETKEKEGWTITFVGTDSDVRNMVRNLSVSAGNTLSYDGTAAGLRSTYTTSNIARQAFAKAVVDGDINNTSYFVNNK